MKDYLVHLSPKASVRGLYTIVAVVQAKSAKDAKVVAMQITDATGASVFRPRDEYTRLQALPLKREEVFYI